jgi:hypothetical protein
MKGTVRTMLKTLLWAAACVLAPSLAWAQSATVESGVKTEITTHMRYDRRCQPNTVKIKIVEAPANGTVTSEPKSIVVPPQSDSNMRQQSICVGKTVAGVAIYYKSEPGFVGQDRFRYQRLNPKDPGDKFNTEVTYTITVK